MKKANSKIGQLLLLTALGLLLVSTANAAAPGITGPTFNLVASPALITQPDGEAVYSWGYGCNGTPSGYAPSAITNAFCNTMQIPGPTLIVTELQRDGHRGRCGTLDARGPARWRHGVVHVYCHDAGDTRLLQWYARGLAG